MSAPATRTISAVRFDRSPVISSIGLTVSFLAVSVGGTLLLGAIAPQLEGKGRDLLVEAMLAGFVLALISVLRWRREAGINAPHDWRHLGLLALPLLITLLPFAGGFRPVEAGTLGLLIVGYTLNSIAEDGMFRGILPRVLQAKSLIWAVVLSSLLFGLAHFGNIASRPDQSFAITAAQSLGAFTEGIGLVMVRLCVASVVPVMVIHALSDLFLQMGGVPIVLANVIHSVIMLGYGIWLFRRYRPMLTADGWR